jgi:hypothetical protein
MEFAAQKKISRQEKWVLDLPNLKEWCYVPSRIEFWTNSGTANNETQSNIVPGSGDIDVTFHAGQNAVYKWGLPYFKINSFLDLSLFLNKIGDGENISLTINNLDSAEKDLIVKVIYREYQGNIIYHNSYEYAMIQTQFANPLYDLANAGIVTKIQIQCDINMKGIIIEPIFHCKEESEKLRGFPLGSIVVEADEPTSIIEIGLEQLQEYQGAMKYFRMRIDFDPTVDKKEGRRSKIHIVAHGFKN